MVNNGTVAPSIHEESSPLWCTCVLCSLSCMQPCRSCLLLVLLVRYLQVALAPAQPDVLGGCRPAWGDAVHCRPPASHLSSTARHAAASCSSVCWEWRTSGQDVWNEAENRHPSSRQRHWQTHWLHVFSYISMRVSVFAHRFIDQVRM